MDRTFLLLGSLAGVTGVALGAFGAHGLRARLSPEMLAVFETGARYHLFHALALILTAVVGGRLDHNRWPTAAGWLFVGGIVLFSGSLYLLAITGTRTFGAITPVGGVLFLLGWTCLGIAAFL